MRTNLKKYHGKTITIYGYFQTFGRSTPYYIKNEKGKKVPTNIGPTACIIAVTKNLFKPLCDHAWISSKTDYKILRKLKVHKGDLLRIKIKVVKYHTKENYTFREIQTVKKIDNKIIKAYYKVLIRLLGVENEKKIS